MNHRSIVYALALACVAPMFAANPKSESPAPHAKKEEKADVTAQLETERKKLAEFLTKYREGHPAMKAQRKKVADLEAQLKNSQR